MRAVVAVIGKDTVGILAKVSNICAECNANVMDVTQTIMQDLFAMTMLIDITKCSVDYNVLADKLKKPETIWVFRYTLCMKIFSIRCTIYNYIREKLNVQFKRYS